jgi:hypothetical protein
MKKTASAMGRKRLFDREGDDVGKQRHAEVGVRPIREAADEAVDAAAVGDVAEVAVAAGGEAETVAGLRAVGSGRRKDACEWSFMLRCRV